MTIFYPPAILPVMKPLYEVLIEWQEANNLTPAEAARRCHVSAQLWHQLKSGETDNPRAGTILKVAQGTGFSMEYLAQAAEAQRAVPA